MQHCAERACGLLQMLSCLEHMYHDLGLVKDFNINPITLKRWLVGGALPLLSPPQQGGGRNATLPQFGIQFVV